MSQRRFSGTLFARAEIRALWQQFGNNVGHATPMPVQCPSDVVVTFAPENQVLFTSFQHVPNATLMADAPDSKSGPRKKVWV
jgi:hypothetical protein